MTSLGRQVTEGRLACEVDSLLGQPLSQPHPQCREGPRKRQEEEGGGPPPEVDVVAVSRKNPHVEVHRVSCQGLGAQPSPVAALCLPGVQSRRVGRWGFRELQAGGLSPRPGVGLQWC